MAKQYFLRGDARRADLLDLFHPEFQLYFPKFGIKRGPQAFMEMVSGFAGELQSIEHDFSTYNFIASGPYVVVEGTTRGYDGGIDVGAVGFRDARQTFLIFGVDGVHRFT